MSYSFKEDTISVEAILVASIQQRVSHLGSNYAYAGTIPKNWTVTRQQNKLYIMSYANLVQYFYCFDLIKRETDWMRILPV